MKIRAGYEIAYDCPQPTPMLLMLSVHPSRTADLADPARIAFDPPVAARDYLDGFGNICTRIIAPPGRLTISADFVIDDPGAPDVVAPDAQQLPSRTCPTRCSSTCWAAATARPTASPTSAWSLFGSDAARLGPGAGDLRLRPQPHHLRLPARPADPHRLRRLSASSAASAATSPTSPSRSAAA